MNQKNPLLPGRNLCIGALALGSLLPCARAQVNFTGGGDGGSWSDPLNWDIGEPINGDAVVIDGSYVEYDFGASETEFESLTLLNDADLYLNPGSDLTFRFTSGIYFQTDGYAQIQSGPGTHVLETQIVQVSGFGTHALSSQNLYLSPLIDTLNVVTTPSSYFEIQSEAGIRMPAGGTLRFNPMSFEFNSSAVRVSGTIEQTSAGTIDVEISGGGVVRLENANDYQGITVVADSLSHIGPNGEGGAVLSGGLYVTNSTGSATGDSEVLVRSTDNDGLDLDNQGILGGNGYIAGDVRFEGGIFLPGNIGTNIGVITLGGSLVMDSGAIFNGSISTALLLDVDPASIEVPGLTNDVIYLPALDATVSLLDVNLGVFLKSAPMEGQVFRFIDAPFQSLAGSITGTFNGLPEGSLIQSDFNSQTYDFTIHYGDNYVELIAIPEPGTFALIAALATLFAAATRRRLHP